MHVIILLAAFACNSVLAGEPRIWFVAPEDGGRVWADEDHPLKIHVRIEGWQLPKDGKGKLYANGKDMGMELIQADTIINVPEIAEGIHKLEARLFDSAGDEIGVTNVTNFQKFTYLELADHEEYYATAEAPRSDGSLDRLPGMEEWVFERSWRDHSASVALQKLLRRKLTEAQITRGDRALEEYKARHDRVMADPNLWKSERFVIFRNINVGLGNQIESMVSAFMFALVTGRIFLCDATPIHHLFQPPDIEWHYTPLPEYIDHEYIYKNSKLVDLRWSNPLEFQQFLCRDLDESLPQRYIFIMSDQYYLPAILHNERYSKMIRKMFGGDIFGTVIRWLLRPKRWIAEEVMHFYNANLENNHVVGVQVRTATMTGYDIEYMAYDAFAWKDFPPAYWKCALLNTPRHSENPVKYMLVTDNPRIRPMAEEALGKENVVWFNQAITRKYMQGHATALIDILLLSLSEDILTTSMSTFGYVACGWSSITPYVVTYQSLCVREITSQPCFHKWSYLHAAQCYNKQAMLSPEVRFCGPMSPPQTMAEPVW